MELRSCKRLGIAFALTLMAAPVLAQDDFIPRGSDIWGTPGDGSTYTDLSLPAGFLDPNCAPFKDRVVLAGVPVVTSPEGAFGKADTVVERITDAVFDEKGVAKAQIVVRALHFRSVSALKTDCGEWTAEVGLAPQQKSTTMTITRNSEGGGTFAAPISVDTVWTFTRNGDGAKRSLTTSNLLINEDETPWSAARTAGEGASSVLVDSNNDGRADLKIAAVSSRFIAGVDVQNRPWSPCRSKGLDPTRHCYEPISAAPFATF